MTLQFIQQCLQFIQQCLQKIERSNYVKFTEQKKKVFGTIVQIVIEKLFSTCL